MEQSEIHQYTNSDSSKTVADLNLSKEIIPLFDYTYNSYSSYYLFKLFQKPLLSREEISNRQHIVKSLMDHRKILSNYAYSRADFGEVYLFLTNTSTHNLKENRNWFFGFKKKEEIFLRSRLIQFILLFHFLETNFFTRLNVSSFPLFYQQEIKYMQSFLMDFNLSYYENLIRENKYRSGHTSTLIKLITQKQSGEEINIFYNYLFHFEALLSVSHCAIKHNFCFPTITENEFSLREVYFPILKNPVKNNFIANHHVAILTGPNMSGKSTFLRSIGLAVYLAHIGFPVPAKQMSVPLYDLIFISINHNDDVKNGYSHFMNEIVKLKTVVEESVNNKKCFAIFDEIFKGTNFEDAREITFKTIEGLLKFKDSFFLISTHLQQLDKLNAIKNKEVETYYMASSLTDNVPVFEFKLERGISKLRLGSILFERSGLNELFE